GNEVLRARRAGFPGGWDPAVIMLTTDVFRDNALEAVVRERVLPNVGSPGMVGELREAGYRGPIGVRINPGFGHGVVEACDTGGPSSKHGVWLDAIPGVRSAAAEAGLPMTVLHAHVGTGPTLPEFDTNVRKLVDLFVDLLPEFPDVETVNLGGGIPHPYRPQETAYDLASYRPIWDEAVARLAKRAGRSVRVEVEPGRYLVAGAGVLVTRVKDVKETRANEKGRGHTFVMVDAGFCDLLRPALYGSYHEIQVVGAGTGQSSVECVVAGPLCESGDVFTRSETELLDPRMLPRPEPGDLLVVQDAGAYGAAMSSNYLSMGRAAEVWWEEGRARLISRRETVEDLVGVECDVAL
ncbi:MAG TPA: diaminopimelate decarboxylase, partial [Candidatus Eisenbacteria bacterium]|nr:diaminopimelate decarboxylase [Candidatus Eisenbacteria bacterium]